MATGKEAALSEADRERIRQAVHAAEQQTRAEIVPMIVARSGLYRDAQHWAGLIAALAMLAALLTIEASWVPWGWHASNGAWLVLAVTLAYLCGTWIGIWPPVIRLLTSPIRLRHKVALRAERAFAQHAISQTCERTGVLIMLSILEKQIYVLPDRSLAGLVSAERWKQVVQAAVERLRDGDIPGGLSHAIHACGGVLADACPARPGDNPNELSDQVIDER
ncbi:MAG: TPM domain-containing protein [Nitrospira sp.]|nr:TPM domain-containing protein [Nitrospira sp.]